MIYSKLFQATIIVVGLLSGCELLGTRDPIETQVRIDLGSLYRTSISGQQTGCVSFAALARLTIIEENGDREVKEAHITGTQSDVTFNIQVEQGMVTFVAEILSNFDLIIYT